MSETPPPPPPPPSDGSGYGAPPPPPPPGGGYGGGPYGGDPYGGPPSGGSPYGGGVPTPGVPAWSVGDAVSFGWRKFQEHLGQILLAVLIVFVANAILQGIGYAVGDSLVLSLLFNLVSWVVTTVLSAGIIRAALDITEGRKPEAVQVLTPPRLPQLLLLGVVTGVLVTVGLVLCILPGLVVILLTSFSTYFLLDRPDLDAIGALKASVNLVKDNLGSVLLWFLVCFGLVLLGAILCLVGLLVTLPIVYLGTAYTYKRLTGQQVVQ